jgi:uncharacterized protein
MAGLGRPCWGSEKRERVSFTLPPRIIQWLKTESESLKLSRSQFLESLIVSRKLKKPKIKSDFPILVPSDEIRDFCIRNNILELKVFGSLLTDNFNSESDIDLLVKFLDDHHPSLFDMVRMERGLSKIFNNHKVDLKTSGELSRYFRDEVLRSAKMIYAA